MLSMSRSPPTVVTVSTSSSRSVSSSWLAGSAATPARSSPGYCDSSLKSISPAWLTPTWKRRSPSIAGWAAAWRSTATSSSYSSGARFISPMPCRIVVRSGPPRW